MDTTATVGQLTAQDVAALNGIVNDWVQILLAANWDKLASQLAEDVVFLPPDQPAVHGKKAVRAWLEAFPPIKTFTSRLQHAEGRPILRQRAAPSR
jgi:ketosteroid isomerase-like protein